MERDGFTPLVFLPLSLGHGEGCVDDLANILSNKCNSSYSLTICWLRCSFSFYMLCSSLMCFSSSHSSSSSPDFAAAVDLVAAEGCLGANCEQ